MFQTSFFALVFWIIKLSSLGGGPGQCSKYSDSLRSGWSVDQLLEGVRFSAHIQTGPGAHPASYTMGTTRSFLEVKWPRYGADHPPPHRVLKLRKSRPIHLLPLWAFIACSRVNFTLTFYLVWQTVTYVLLSILHDIRNHKAIKLILTTI